MTICLAPRVACGGGVLRSRFTCRVFGRASILAFPSLERRRMTKMPPDGYPALQSDGYPALQYLQSVRVRTFSSRPSGAEGPSPGPRMHAIAYPGLETSSAAMNHQFAPRSLLADIRYGCERRAELAPEDAGGGSGPGRRSRPGHQRPRIRSATLNRSGARAVNGERGFLKCGSDNPALATR